MRSPFFTTTAIGSLAIGIAASAWYRPFVPRGLDIATALHGQHSTPDRQRMRLRQVLVGAQVAPSLVLLVTTRLFLRALESAAGADTGVWPSTPCSARGKWCGATT